MMKLFSKLLIVAAILASGLARADIVVQIHGYLGSANSWENSGINSELRKNGWHKAGNVFMTPYGAMMTQFPENAQEKPIYSVELPSKAPIRVQANILEHMVQDLQKRHPDENITLVGHSAGGIVARLKLVQFGAGNVNRLITIASPHLGTGLATYALKDTSDLLPIDFIKDILGGSVYDTAKSSKGLLVDLQPIRPGSFLDWLNHQSHPDIEYISIIRGQDPYRSGDRIVPGFSQDMNQVAALYGRSKVYYVPTSHYLSPVDGNYLNILLKDKP